MTAKATTRPIGAAAALAAAWLLAACTMGDVLPTAAGGLPADAPARPAQAAGYPAVHDMPPKRDEKPLTGAEQLTLEKDLEAQRVRMEAGAKAAGASPPPAAKRGSTATSGSPSGTGGSRNP